MVATVAAVVLLSVLAGWLIVSALAGGDGSAAPGDGNGSAAAAAGSDRPSDADPGAEDESTKGGSTSGGSDEQSGDAEDDGTGNGGTSAGPPKGGTVVEHRPADSEETAAPQPGEKGFHLPGLGKDEPPAYLIDQAPEPDRATGAVVAGYPVAYLRVPKRAQVDASEVSSQGRRVQAVLEATCDCSVADVVAFHDRTLARLGMTGKAAAATGGATARSYADRNDSITLTVRRDRGTTTYTLFSVITAARA